MTSSLTSGIYRNIAEAHHSHNISSFPPPQLTWWNYGFPHLQCISNGTAASYKKEAEAQAIAFLKDEAQSDPAVAHRKCFDIKVKGH